LGCDRPRSAPTSQHSVERCVLHGACPGRTHDCRCQWHIYHHFVGFNDPIRPHRLSPPIAGSAHALAFASDGRTLASVSNDNKVILWDVTDPTQPLPLGMPFMTGHDSRVSTLAYTKLATAKSDGTVILWNLGLLLQMRDQTIELACTYANGGLSPQEWTQYISGLPYIETPAPNNLIHYRTLWDWQQWCPRPDAKIV
jgi:WD40 repeat protein